MNFEVLQDGITVIRFPAYPTLSDVKDAIDKIAAIDDTGYRAWDISAGFDLSTQEIIDLAAYAKNKWPKTSKVAFIAPDLVAFGMSRMFSSLKSQNDEEYNVFKSEPEALAFLRE